MINQFKVLGRIATGLILWTVAIVCFGVTIWLLIADKTASASIGAGFGILVLVLANLDRIESFKGFGIEAKTRDLRNAIVDAENTLERLEAMSSEVKSLSESINTLHMQLDETKTIAERAQFLAM